MPEFHEVFLCQAPWSKKGMDGPGGGLVMVIVGFQCPDVVREGSAVG